MMNLAEHCNRRPVSPASCHGPRRLRWRDAHEGQLASKGSKAPFPDLDSSVPAELVAVAVRFNNPFRRLGPD